MALSNAEKLAKLEAQKQATERKIKALKEAEKTEKRKADNRKKILIGAMMLNKVEQNRYSYEALMRDMDSFLSRDNERALFNLKPLENSISSSLNVSIECG